MTAILGISAFYHDSAAALVVDGRVVAAAQEERFSRKKHDAAFPRRAIDYCLAEAGLTPSQIDHVGFYEKPLLKFDRLLETYLSFAPSGFRSFRKAMPEWAGPKLQLRREIRRGLGHQYQGRICFCEHHQSHAASAFFPSPFERAAILTFDGVGEWATTSVGIGRGNQIELLKEIRFPHSLGLLYSACTYYTGFRVNSDEYKLMGLAPYGEPRFADVIREKLITVHEDGSYRLNLDFFQYCQGLTMTSRRFHQLFGRPPRKPDEPISELDMDLAASVQRVTEELVLLAARHAHQVTGLDNLCLAGGVALNCVANGRLLREGPFERIWIQPGAGDAGGALGVALLLWHQLIGQARDISLPDAQAGSLLGPELGSADLSEQLDALGAVYQHVPSDEALAEQLAGYLDQGKLIGLARGRMEFGPRALGNRSIVADPRRPEIQRELNLRTKFRESFRPFAPIVLAERAAEYFELKPGQESPYMLLVSQVKPTHRLPINNDLPKGVDRVHDVRSSLPAITHVDYSARIQTVDKTRNPFLRGLLEAFDSRTGCPVLVNTSFNIRDEPIVCTWLDALSCFLHTNLDVLVLENLVLHKSEQGNVDVSRLQKLRQQSDSDDRLRQQREATWFVISLVLALAVFALLFRFRFQAPAIGWSVLTVAGVIAVLALVIPTARPVIERGFKALTYPIRATVTLLVLGLVYYGLVTPIGLLRRALGHSVRTEGADAASQWVACPPRDLESYFRTY
jgi:carbamoyltransferase